MIDYASAATRHLADAESLLRLGRADNARYLGGYTVECGLKAVVELAFRAKAFGHDLETLEDAALDICASVAPHVVRYRPSRSDVHFVRDRWSSSLRYEPTSAGKLASARDFVAKARAVWNATVGEMLLDGLLAEVD